MSRMRPLPALTALLATGLVLTSAACSSAAEHADADKSATPAPAAVTTTAASKDPSETVTPLLKQVLPNAKGRTFSSIVVDYPPSARSVPHRHGQAFVYAYVLEGTVRSKLGDGPTRTYHQGQNWTERPGAHHVVSMNTSRTQHAKLLVVFVSDTGDPLTVNDPAT